MSLRNCCIEMYDHDHLLLITQNPALTASSKSTQVPVDRAHTINVVSYFTVYNTPLFIDKPGCIDDQTIQISDALKRCQNETQDSKFIDTILASIPAKAAQCGIFSVSTLERRFENVFEECKKAALCPNSSGLFTSIYSNLYSKVMVYSTPPRYSEESQLDRCGTKGMDAKELLIQAHYFVERRCLAAALKCMNQLEGVPRCLAQDWIDETRLFLEVQQATEALYSYAMSKGLGQIF